MPRHAANESPTRVAGWIWAALIAVVVIAAVVIAWLVVADRDGDDDNAADCIDGNQRLLVWADPAAEEIATDLVDSYNDSSPVVRDRCVTAEVEVTPTAEAVAAYRGGEPGVAPVWIPAGTSFVAGLSGAPQTVPVVGTDELVHVVPQDADPAPAAALVPSGPESMVGALGAVAAVPDDDPAAAAMDGVVEAGRTEGVTPQQAQESGRPYFSSTGVLDKADLAGDDSQRNPVGEVEFPLVSFGSSPAVDEESSRVAADFADKSVEGGDTNGNEVTPEMASPRLTSYAGVD